MSTVAGLCQGTYLPDLVRTVPLSLVTTDASGKPQVDRAIVLDEREKFIPLDTSNSFKLNGGTTGVCQYHILRSCCPGLV